MKPFPKRVVPNLLTLGNLLAGATALALLSADAPPAAVLACVAAGLVFDLLDGRVARALKVDNPFGTQLDSLADVVSFGLVPALAVWQWKLSDFGWAAAPLAGTIAAAAAWRLARFNVQASDPGPARVLRGAARSTGLPVTFPAALLLAGAVAVPEVPAAVVAVLAPALALLMIGRLPYRTFKDRSPLRLVAFAAGCAVVAAALHPLGAPVLPTAIALGAALYIASAPVAAVARRLTHAHGHRDL
jgi:CDP-diacylglycerol--serine O-phosphatidyltransferase